MIYLLMALSFITGILRGFAEGMDMITPYDSNYKMSYMVSGVRAHVWFRWYHLIDLAGMACLVVLAILTWEIRPSWLFITAQLFAFWEGFEIAYWYARDKRFIGKTELITVLDLLEYRLNGWQVKLAHLARVVLAVLLFKQGV